MRGSLFLPDSTAAQTLLLTEYSCRIDPASYPSSWSFWFDARGKARYRAGESFDLDFHTIPFHGEDALARSTTSPAQPAAERASSHSSPMDADRRVFCYGNAQGEKRPKRRDPSLRRLLKARHRRASRGAHLRLQAHHLRNLNRLNQMGIAFITLRRRSQKLLEEIFSHPPSAWRRIELTGLSRVYRTPRILDGRVTLPRYQGPLRQVDRLGPRHEEPTLLLTNQLRLSRQLIGATPSA